VTSVTLDIRIATLAIAVTASCALTRPVIAGDVSTPAPHDTRQPEIVARGAAILDRADLRFKDLNRNGTLEAYEDWRLSPERRAADLVGRMTPEEKAGMMMHAANSGFLGAGGVVLDELAPLPPGAMKSPVNVPGVPGFDRADKPSPRDLILRKHVRWISTTPGGKPGDAARWANALQEIAEGSRLGIPVMLTADPVHTTNRLPGGALPPPDRVKITSSWPDQVGLAAIGDPDLVERFGRIVAAEYRALGFRMLINPMADLATEPRWYRIPGTFGEDADLAATLVAAYVRGVQGDRLGPESVLTVVKHFPGNGPVSGGFDPHNPYGKYQIYPAGMMEYHLQPFRAGIAAGTAAVMPGYAIAEGIDTVGMNFSRAIVTDLLRERLGFDGIVLSEWLHAMPWGVESLSKREQQARMIAAGVDQFGGEHDPAHVIVLAEAGRVTAARLDQSMFRLLTPMFSIGLFENPYVDPDAAATIVNSAEYRAAGEAAQRRAVVLLENEHDVLPLARDARLHVSGFSAPPHRRVVPTAVDADVVIVKINAPYVINKSGESFFAETHEGALVYAGADNFDDLQRVHVAVRSGKPVVVLIGMERPAVLSEFIEDVSAVLATFGSDDAAVWDILTGAARPRGKLPFDLPADQASVEMQKEDAPHDFARTLFQQGFGLSYDE